MRLLGAFLKLVRYPNLIYIFLTQYLLQYCVIIPVFGKFALAPTLSNVQFFFLSLSTVMIAAAGYIINDYFDINIDLVNKPEKIVVDKLISRRWAMVWHTVLNIAGVLTGFILGWQVGYILLGLTQLVCSGLLWFYSTSYKKQLLAGNVVIALLTALTVMGVGFYEPRLYSGISRSTALPVLHLLRIILVYAAFAFTISMVREIIKDLEDMKGDSREGSRTMPVVWGVNACKDISYVFLWFLVGAVLFIQVKIAAWSWWLPIIYLLLFVQVPALIVTRKLKKAITRTAFRQAGNYVKLIMLTGILSMVFFKFMW